MTRKQFAFAFVGTTLAAALAVGVARAGGDDWAKEPGHTPLKAIHQPFFDSLVGSWSSESTGEMGAGKGKATFALGIGGTALIETYENVSMPPEGTSFTLNGHGVFKLSDDGKTVNAWWFCNVNPDVQKLSGPVTDKGWTLTGDGPKGPITLIQEKTADGMTLRITEGDREVVKETYRK
jgi:hypothetical protein